MNGEGDYVKKEEGDNYGEDDYSNKEADYVGGEEGTVNWQEGTKERKAMAMMRRATSTGSRTTLMRRRATAMGTRTRMMEDTKRLSFLYNLGCSSKTFVISIIFSSPSAKPPSWASYLKQPCK